MNFSLATFNLCHLQMPNHLIYDEFAWKPDQYQRKIGWIAEQLKAVHPVGVFCFQEVWSARALAEVFHISGLGQEYRLVCQEGEDNMNVACAVHRSLSIAETEWIHTFPEEVCWQTEDLRYEMAMSIQHFSRPLLRVRLQAPDGRGITVYNTHLKSRRPTSPGNNRYYGVGADHWLDIGRTLSSTRRLAEAAVLRLLVNRQLAQTTDAIAVCGDFNDRHPGLVLDVVKGDSRYRPGNSNRSGRRADWGLYHLLELDATKRAQQTHSQGRDYITFCGEDELLALDHMLFSWHFHPRAAECRWQLQDWSLASQHLGGSKPYASDHAMVIARFSGYRR